MQTTKIIVIWIIDDEITNKNVKWPLRDLLYMFAHDPAVSSQCGEPEIIEPPRVDIQSPQLRECLRWIMKIKLTPKPLTEGPFCSEKDQVELVVYAFSDWEAPAHYLQAPTPVPQCFPFWPRLVLTDLYNGSQLERPLYCDDDFKQLSGFKFVELCAGRMDIPCVLFTSDSKAFSGRFDHLLQSSGKRWPLNWYERENMRASGSGKALLHLWQNSLLRWVWMPQLALTLEGKKLEDKDRYRVIIRNQFDGTILSDRSDISAREYNYLYLWAYGSVLAFIKNWNETADLKTNWDMDDCVCPAVCTPPKSQPHASAHLTIYRTALFERGLWDERKDKIYFGGGTHLLNANIVHLDVPSTLSLPNFWTAPEVKPRLIKSMRPVLPAEGMCWLERC